MERVLYIVAREHALLSGYLRTTVGARASGEQRVEIKLDERRAERRLSGEARDPDRRQGDRRLWPSLDQDLRSYGFAVVRSEAGSSLDPTPAPAVWRPRASRRQRAARAGRRRRARWGLVIVLLAAVGVSIIVARFIDRAPAPPQGSPQIAAPIALGITPPSEPPAPPPAASSRREAGAPAAPPAAPTPARPAPVRIVSMRSSGVVLAVDPGASMLVLDERGVGGEARRLRIELAPEARVVLSERADRAEDVSRLFKDTPIDLSDIRTGDYVVVERRGPEGKELAQSVVVTFRPMK
ncbi:MAG TPA: hypothetical protein VNC82_22210 [Candidatus Limnocylindria bacterium]|nr:hypothetical protein [Candidatus Limnocylindria bacterium]